MEVQGPGLLSYAQEQQGALLLGGLVALAYLATHRRGLKAAGVGLMTVPAWQALLGVLPDLALPFAGNPVPFEPLTFTQESSRFAGPAVRILGPLGAGFLMWAIGREPRLVLRPRMSRLAAHLRATGIPLGDGEGAGIRLGLAAFPLLALTNLLLLWATAGLSNSDESRLDANITLYHVVLIAAVAAVSEELLYRGLVQTGLWRLGRRQFPTTSLVAAIVLQATLFGFAHAGYQNLQHFVFATLFGLFAGIVAWRFGIWAAITLHFLIDLYSFGLNLPWLWPLLGLALLAMLALTWRTTARSLHAGRLVA